MEKLLEKISDRESVELVSEFDREIELILFAAKFQKIFHGRAALGLYLDSIAILNRLMRPGASLSDLRKYVIHKYVFRKLGVSVAQAELSMQRQMLCRALEQNIHFVFPGHPHFPRALLGINEPPFLLSYLGSPVWMSEQGLAVVGSRNAHPLTISWMESHLGPCLEKVNAFVVSGGARGVDQKAHLLALAKKRPTVIFVPSGLGKIYPQNLESFIEPVVAAGGAIVSEYSFNEPMKKHYFHARNRLISGLAVCTLITQAARKSGTLITGRQAIEQSRPVFVVPSHPLDVDFQGGLDLLMEGATPVRDCQDLVLLLESELNSSRAFSRLKDSEHQTENSYS